MPQPHPIVACARSWVGTRFHHQGRVKRSRSHRGGVDCLGLLVGVAGELALALASADERDYSHQPDHARLRRRLAELLKELPKAHMAPGDIVLLNIAGNPQHLGIVSDDAQALGLIHAYAPAKAVVEHRLDGWWEARIEAVFRVEN